jgi:hypothetical protein
MTLTGASPPGHRTDAHEPSCPRNPVHTLIETRLTDEEHAALVTVLYVVKDNWWLTDVEERVLSRLELRVEDDEHEREHAERDPGRSENGHDVGFDWREHAGLERPLHGSFAA